MPQPANSCWGRLCFDSGVDTYGLGDESGKWRYTFTKDGSPIVLDGDNKEEFQIILNDNFDELNEHNFRIGMYKL
jgi:hypothetical protein